MARTLKQPIVYVFLDNLNRALYVGRTSNPWQRMKRHFRKGSHVDPRCYDEVDRILIAPCSTRLVSLDLERHFIIEWLPVYNQHTPRDRFSGRYDPVAGIPVEWREWNAEEWRPVKPVRPVGRVKIGPVRQRPRTR
jgi:hypothetical protein